MQKYRSRIRFLGSGVGIGEYEHGPSALLKDAVKGAET